HQRLLERVPHVQRAGDVGRRQLDAVSGLAVVPVAKVAGRLPALVPALLDGARLEAFLHDYFFSCGASGGVGGASALATEAATASRTSCVTLRVSSVRMPSMDWPRTLVRVRASFSSMIRSTSGPSRSSTARSSSRAS